MRSRILKYVIILPTKLTLEHKDKANEIIGSIDVDDVIFIATALAFPDAIIWSEDKHFLKQKSVKVLTTRDLVKLIW